MNNAPNISISNKNAIYLSLNKFIYKYDIIDVKYR